LFHEGEKENIHLSVVAERVILVVIFDQRSSLGLVRLRVRKSGEVLTQIFTSILNKSKQELQEKESRSPFSAITEADIDRLFG